MEQLQSDLTKQMYQHQPVPTLCILLHLHNCYKIINLRQLWSLSRFTQKLVQMEIAVGVHDFLYVTLWLLSLRHRSNISSWENLFENHVNQSSKMRVVVMQRMKKCKGYLSGCWQLNMILWSQGWKNMSAFVLNTTWSNSIK
jgi:hypothetical protein